MKNKVLLLAATALFFGWSCTDKHEGTDLPIPTQVATVAEAQNALNQGATTVTITEPIVEDAALVVPNNYAEGTRISLTVPAAGHSVSVKQDNSKARSFPLVDLNISNADDLIIEMPDCSVTFSGQASSIISTTADNSLTIAKGANGGDITVKKGSLKLYGIFSSVTNQGDGRVMLAIGSGTDRPVTDHIIRETLALDWIDGMILTEGKYALNADMVATGSEFGQNDPVYTDQYNWYMPVEKDNFYILGDGKVENIILYGKQQTANGMWSQQNLITVFAKNVTIEGITLKNKIAGNKMIEVLNTGFTVRNCRFVPNDEVGEPETGTDGQPYMVFTGGVYFSQKADNGLVEGNYFKEGTVSVDGLMGGTFNVNGNTFDGAYNNDYVVISTPIWTTNDVSVSTMKLNLDNNEFRNVPEFAGSTVYPVVNVRYGTVTLTNNTFPTTGIYYRVTEYGKIVMNGTEITPAPAQ